MSLRLEIVSRQRQGMRGKAVKEFGPDGGTIGRSLHSDWALPDNQRILSSQHASIDFRSGSYYIVDTSTNGVFINGASEAVGKGKPQRLFTGDTIRIGDYEIKAEIVSADGTMETCYEEGHVDPVDAAQLVEAPDPTQHDLVDAFEITGVGIEIILDEDEGDTLTPLAYRFDASGTEPAQAPAAPQPAAKSTAKPQKSAGHGRTSGDEPAAVATAGAAALVAAFCEGAGIDAVSMSNEDARKAFFRIGQTFHCMLAGIVDSIRLRAMQKAQLQQQNTVIQPAENNLLKFSANADEALTRMLEPEDDTYMTAVESVRETFADLNAHQQAMVKVLPAVLNRYLGQLDPDSLEEKFAGASRNRILGAANKLRYWDLYRDVYLVMSQQSDDELPEAFSEMLTDAYAEEIERTKARNAAALLARKVG